MINAKEEFVEHVSGQLVKCAIVYYERKTKIASFPVGFLQEAYDEFLEMLNFEYNNNNGTQSIFGVIWYADETWSERSISEKLEWWEYISPPKIPEVCKYQMD